MKNFFYFSTLALMLTACSSDIELSSTGAGETAKSATENAIGFQVINRNKTRGGDDNTSKLLQNNGHYNFGVFAYKNLSDNSQQTVMDNYLVGYYDETGKKGYKLDGTKQTTIENSKWAYEKLGSDEYSYTKTEGESYYTGTANDFYTSNNKTQYLKYWDKSTSSTDFYAYAPYLNGTGDATASYDASKKTLTIGNTGIQDGYDDASKYDYLYSHVNVSSNDYGNNVVVPFSRISAMIKIGFYEQIAGYSVKILDLTTNGTGVCAAPSIEKTESGTTTYSYGTLYHKGGATVDFSGASPSLTVTGNESHKFVRDNTTKDHLVFAAPANDAISTENTTEHPATMSKTQYYLIPNNTNKTGLTFHITYQLKAEDSEETITVHNATVFIPYSAVVENKTVEYCNWQPNHIYTYIFKITKATSGDTSTPGDNDIDPSAPSPKKDTALSPIIFDGCTVENWVDTDKSEHELK